MADAKKPDAKPAAPPSTSSGDPFVDLVWVGMAILIGLFILNGFINMISNSRLFSGGLSGFTPRGILMAHTNPISALSNPIGARVVSLNKTDVYDTPGGRKIGSHRIGAKGKILQGPVVIRGERYWYVDYDSGKDGWVRETDIAHLEKEPGLFARFVIGLLSFFWFFKIFLLVLSMALILFSIHLSRKLTKLQEAENKLLYPENMKVNLDTPSTPVNPAWERVLQHVESVNESDWRLAILEADIILSDLLDKLGLPGDTIGDKLKAVEKSDFVTIDNAWEAHKTRNRVAHDGQEFVLTQREAKRIVDLYQSVFEEFSII